MSFDSQLARLLSMAGVEVKRQFRCKTVDRVKAGKCLVCDQDAVQRGVCIKHYTQFYRAKMALPKRDRATFEKTQIEQGTILAVGQSREIKNPNIYESEAS
jgi:hypothetical protein